MEKAIVDALVGQLTKEELEKRTPELRNMVRTELERFIGSEKCRAFIKRAIETATEEYFDADGIGDLLDSSSLNKLVRRTVNKIVSKI